MLRSSIYILIFMQVARWSVAFLILPPWYLAMKEVLAHEHVVVEIYIATFVCLRSVLLWCSLLLTAPCFLMPIFDCRQCLKFTVCCTCLASRTLQYYCRGVMRAILQSLSQCTSRMDTSSDFSCLLLQMTRELCDKKDCARSNSMTNSNLFS